MRNSLPPGADQEWHDLLNQLRRQPHPQPRPFFYARVQARLDARRAGPLPWLPGWLRRPAYAALLGALVLSLTGDCAADGAVAGNAGPGYQAPRALRR